MEFQDWIQHLEARARQLSSPSTYGKAPAKPKRKKPARKPSQNIDGFIKEIDLLKKDLDALGKKRKDDTGSQPPAQQPAQVGDEELLRLAKIVLSNLKISPKYYSVRMDDLGGEEAPGKPQRKVNREEAARIARQLGVDFKVSKFSQDAFRKALESEVSRSSKPSTFDRSRTANPHAIPLNTDQEPEAPETP